jgi:class 3 adenylate cyclase
LLYRSGMQTHGALATLEPLETPTRGLLRSSQVRLRRTLLCSDIVGYTGLLSRLGDRPALHLVRRHDAIVRGCAAAHGGRLLELRGDSFLVSFARREGALACAVDVQRELAADRAAHPDGGVRVRIAVHTGDVLVERGRYFGLEVVVPFRLCEAAGTDEILASGAPEAGADAPAGRARVLSLKGIPHPVCAVPVDWRSDRGAPAAAHEPAAPRLALAGR